MGQLHNVNGGIQRRLADNACGRSADGRPGHSNAVLLAQAGHPDAQEVARGRRGQDLIQRRPAQRVAARNQGRKRLFVPEGPPQTLAQPAQHNRQLFGQVAGRITLDTDPADQTMIAGNWFQKTGAQDTTFNA